MSNIKTSRILIVDDVSRNIQMVANILKQEGYQMSFARNGTAALSIIKSENFDLILLDIMMPEMDGYEVCSMLKKDTETRDIPVIFLTAKTDTESILKGFETGGVDYISKPFNAPELLARVKTHLRLKQANEQLKELNATKDKFFSIIAHDLKNPFTGLISGTNYLIKSLKTMERQRIKKYLLNMNIASKEAFNLLENLLEWSRTQTQSIAWEPEKTDLNEIVTKNISVLKQNAEEKNIIIDNKVTPETVAYADTNMTNTIIRNLLTNAVKFTDKGGKVIVTSQDSGDCVSVSVSDTGIGISQESINKLFRIDIKHTTTGTSGEQGTGLGLILCKEFAEKNGGSIRVESEFGNGAIFTLTLPACQ